jgi:hypothetical protein
VDTGEVSINGNNSQGGASGRQCFIEAERHVEHALRLIEAGRCDAATGAMKTCSLLLDLLEGVRSPLVRLGRVGRRPTQ